MTSPVFDHHLSTENSLAPHQLTWRDRCTPAFWLTHLCASTVIATVIVAMPMGHVVGVIPWLMITGIAWRSERKHHRHLHAITIYVTMTTVIVGLAIYSPVKSGDAVLDNRLQLPSVAMTLADMDAERNFSQTCNWLPSSISIVTNSTNVGNTIHFPVPDLTVRQFIESIEQQSELWHRFVRCGNDASILFGPGPSSTIVIR